MQDRLTAVVDISSVRTLPPTRLFRPTNSRMPQPRARPQGLVSVDLGAMRCDVAAAAAAANVTVSEWVRASLARRLADPPSAVPGPPPPASTPAQSRQTGIPADDESPPVFIKTTLRLEATALAHLTAHAAHEGITRARWIERQAMGRHAGAGTAGLTPGEIEALSRSTYELAGLARNLNQIARSLHAQPGLTTSTERQAIAKAVATARSHVDLASAVIAQLGPAQRPRRARRTLQP